LLDVNAKFPPEILVERICVHVVRMDLSVHQLVETAEEKTV